MNADTPAHKESATLLILPIMAIKLSSVLPLPIHSGSGEK
jgi:hypothetical protein